MRKVNDRVVPLLEPERTCALVGAITQQRVSRKDVSATRLPAGDSLELAQFLERIDAGVRIRADADADRARANALDGKKAVTEIRFRRGAGAHARARVGKQIQFVAVRVRRVDHGRPFRQTTSAVEQLDRTQTVLLQALVDLARLLVGVHMERQIVLARIGADLLEPIGWTGTNRVGGDADARATSQLLDLREVFLHGALTEAGETAAPVGGEKQHDLNPRFLGRVDRGEGFVETEVVELAHSRVPGPAKLAIDLDVLAANAVRGLALRLGEHEVAPGPEVPAAAAPAKGPLERVAVRVDEARQGKGLVHGGIFPVQGPDYPSVMSARAVPVPLQQLPNALTIGRLVLIPIFVALMLAADGGHSWPAGIVFGAAGVTDQIDGFLARRWRVESQFGRIVDPLADRLMIDAAVILLFVADHMPWAGLVVIVGRDLVLLLGYRAVSPQGYDFHVNLLGKAATWLLYAGVGFLIVTHRSTHWPYWIFWAGLALALAAGAVYASSAWREVRR